MPDESLSLTFAALADPTRRAIVARLARGGATVTELAEALGNACIALQKARWPPGRSSECAFAERIAGSSQCHAVAA
jgi:DNA-binding transcriptional ArsR family regulator